jgi:YD repeat-containing protein
MTTSTSVHSNAFNFMSFLESGVDPRTGQYTVSITLPDVKTNDLRGPGMPLALTYNPLNTQDSGFGPGWNLQLSQYTPGSGSQILALSTGETFKVTGSKGDQLVMKEKKIDSFHFFQLDDTHYRLEHKSGLVEILELRGSSQNRVALPVEIYAPEGHKVTLDYEPFSGTHQILSWIKDDSGQTLLSVKRESSSVEVLLQPFAGPEGGPLARFVMSLEGTDKRVSKITLPTENGASWRFGYGFKNDQLCITSVETPTGGREEVSYQDLGHQFPAGSGRTPLARVTGLLTYPGFDQPMVDVRYTYPQEKNFLGFGLPISWTDDGLDNLYKYIGTYEYQCVETLWVADEPTDSVPNPEPKPVRTIERTFNQFHLLTSEKTTQNKNVQTVDTTYHLTPGDPFEAQPNNCQLPKAVITTWALLDSDDDVIRQRSETVSSTYDTHGNLLTQTQANGVVETSTWYPAADVNDFVRRLKDRTVTPAASANGKAPTLRTRYIYQTLPPLTGSPLAHWYTPLSETLVQLEATTETELQQTVYTYINQPGDAFLHGRVEQQTVTMKGHDTITEYGYSKLDGPVLEESVLQTVETLTGFDHGQNERNVKKVITLQHSLLNGEPLLTRDDNNVQIRYAYDALRRVISETVAPNTKFVATRHYEYKLCAKTGDQAEQWMFDVKNVKTCTKFDGLNRAIYEERDDADNPARADKPRQIYAAIYDAWGHLVAETEYDWLDQQALALTSSFEYDDWGEQRCITGPDGVKTFEETDPIGTIEHKGPIQRSWREGGGSTPMISGVTETWLNLFEKPVRTERFDLAENGASLHQYLYDGLGRTAKEIVGFGEVQRETLYSYDAFDRMIENTLPGGAVVRRSYAAHSAEDLPILISVDNIVLGEQLFDGLNRMVESVTGGRKQVFTFEPGQTQPKTVTTPGGQKIEYGYQPQLGEEPVLRRLPRVGTLGGFDEATYDYDEENARLLICEEQGLKLTRDYYSTGELKSESRAVKDGENTSEYTMNYQYSRLGRLLGYTDVLRQEQSYEYDPQGRLKETQLGTTVSKFTYDSLGQTATINTSDSGQVVGITLEYDEFGRETLRTFDLNGVGQTLSQAYNDVDCLTQRTLKEGDTVLRCETYQYDLRGRLTIYECTGTQPPVDPYNKAISKQVFTFDAMDNLTLVMTHFGEEQNRARYWYENPDKTQLSKVTNNHADYPQEILLKYNVDGHLICDEESRTLEYDALGRLIEVRGESGGLDGSYDYDPLDTVSGVSNEGGQEHRFYKGDELTTQISGSIRSSFMRGDNKVLAEHQAGVVPKS